MSQNGRQFLFGEEAVTNGPGFSFAKLHHHVDVGFGTNGCADGPEVQLGDGRIGRLFDAYSRRSIFDREVIVSSAARISRQVASGRLSWPGGQLFQIDDAFAVDFRVRLEWVFGLRFEGKVNLHTRSGGNSIEHEEVVVVNLGVNGFGTRVLQAMFEDEHRLVFVELQSLIVDIGVANRRLEMMGENDLCSLGADRPFSSVDIG